jgi:hypothetical protein
VVAVAVLLLAAVGQAHAERRPVERRFRIVYAESVAAQYRVYIAAANQGGQPRHAAGMHHHRPRHHNDLLSLLDGLPHQRRGLTHGGLHLPFRGDAVGHERERKAVPLLRFGPDADAAQSCDNRIALPQIAQAAAEGAVLPHHDHGVHALILHLNPLLPVAYRGAMVGGRVEILRRAAVALHRAQRRVARVHRRAAQLQQGFEKPVQRSFVRRLHLQPEIRCLAIGAADAELVHLEAAMEFHDLIEDALHHVRIDQVSFGLDYFLQWHGNYQFSVLAQHARTVGANGIIQV